MMRVAAGALTLQKVQRISKERLKRGVDRFDTSMSDVPHLSELLACGVADKKEHPPIQGLDQLLHLQ